MSWPGMCNFVELCSLCETLILITRTGCIKSFCKHSVGTIMMWDNTLMEHHCQVAGGRGNLSMNSFLHSNCSMVESFPGKSRWCWSLQVCLGVKYKALSKNAGLDIGLWQPLARGASESENPLAPQKTHWPPKTCNDPNVFAAGIFDFTREVANFCTLGLYITKNKYELTLPYEFCRFPVKIMAAYEALKKKQKKKHWPLGK